MPFHILSRDFYTDQFFPVFDYSINEVESKYKELKATVSLIYQEKDGKIASLQREIDGLVLNYVM